MKDKAASVGNALRKSGGLFLGVGLFSGVINVLALTGAVNMLQVYDRVIPSRSVPTLIGLSIIMLGLFAANGILDLLRTRIMSRIGLRVDEVLRDKVFAAMQTVTLRARTEGDGVQSVRDLDRVRTFLSGVGPTALFDLPWIPVYLVLIFLLHPLMGWFSVAGALLLIGITYMTELLSTGPTMKASKSGSVRSAMAGAAGRNAEVVRAMGFGGNVQKRWVKINNQHLGDQIQASDAVAGMGVISKTIRLLLQSGILGLGAYLVVKGEVSPGSIIAGSIVMSRALAPIETAIQHWRGFVEARQAAVRLKALFQYASEDQRSVTELPDPVRSLVVENLSVAAPGQTKPAVNGVSFSLKAGEALGIIGPSGSGKSTLARALVGVWLPARAGGAVRLDGAALDQWSPGSLGRHVGYLPQDIQLFEGTVAENIARLDADAASEDIVAAAQDAGAHELIVGLPNGYDTRLGDNGVGLSAGQRQRIALARALYGRPFFVVLDEPNSNLDSAGDNALSAAIRGIRERGGIVIVIAHRPSALAHVDKVLALASGQVQAIGPKEEVLRKVLSPVSAGGRQAQAGQAAAQQVVSPLRMISTATDPRTEAN